LRSVGDAHWARAVASVLGVCLGRHPPCRYVKVGYGMVWYSRVGYGRVR